MAGCLVLPVVFLLVLISVDCLRVNPRPGELFVTCPLVDDYQTNGFAIYGSKKGDNTDISLVYGCNWPQGSDGQKDCRSFYSVSLVQLGERRVDLSVPTAFFSSNSRFTRDIQGIVPCSVFEPDEVGVTASTPSVGVTASTLSPSSPVSTDDNAVTYLAIVLFFVILLLLVLAVVYIIRIQRRRNNKWKESFKVHYSERAHLLGDVETACPQLLFKASPLSSGDKSTPLINCILPLPDDRLMFSDICNDSVKVGDETLQDVTASLTVDEGPRCLALLPDGLVAMTTSQPLIYLMTVTDSVTVTAKIQTDKQYAGIAGLSEDHLIVSYDNFSRGTAGVDILTREGTLFKTVTDNIRLPELKRPRDLCLTGDGHVMVSDCKADKVFQVNINSGQATLTHQHADMKWPQQMCVDRAGQLYVASVGGQCVLKRDQAGEWAPILKTPHYSDLVGMDSPKGLCVTSSDRLVVAWRNLLCGSIVITYKL